MNLPLTASLELPPLSASPGVARQFVACLLSATEVPVDPEAALLLTSELVSNAVQHSTEPVGLRVDLHDDRLHVEVSDIGSGKPDIQALDDPLAECGRGLFIVDVVAAAWGVEVLADRGKVVWFDVAALGGEA